MSSNERGRSNGPSLNTSSTTIAEQRAWRRHVNDLPDHDLIKLVRDLNSVDKAVTAYRGRL
jgi:hypothetical protein